MRHTVITGNSDIIVSPYNDYYCAGRHTHDRLEIKYIISGTGKHFIDGDSFDVSAGDIFLLGLSASHYIQCEKENPVMAYNLNVTLPAMEQALIKSTVDRSLFDKPYAIFRDIQGYVQTILAEMHAEYTGRTPGWHEMLRAGLLRILVFMARTGETPKQDKQKSNDPFYIALSFINSHYSETITLDYLAELAGYNASYFSRRFKQLMGVSVSEYIHKLRVVRACVYLRESRKSFAEIAYRVGYENENYFRSVFRRITGKNPKDYRNECRKIQKTNE